MLRRVGLLGLLLVVVVAVAPAGAPVQLSYVYSDSMEPTIGVDDGYVLVPAGAVTDGDIVTFWSPAREAYVTHRVVGETEGGFVTRGDNNPTTDQASGYPPVSREQIRGKVLLAGGEPVVIPSLGSVVSLLRANVPALVALTLGVSAATLVRSAGRPGRRLTRVRDVAVPLFLIAALVGVGALAYGGTSQELTYVAVDSPTADLGPSAMAVGSSKRVTLVVDQSASPFATRTVSVVGADVTETRRTPSEVSVVATVPPPTTTGPVPVTVRVMQHPSVVPAPVLQRLTTWHPLAAATATVGALLVPVLLVYGLLFDGAEPVRPTRSRLWRTLTGGDG